MKIALVSPRGIKKMFTAKIPHGLLQICAQLKLSGHTVDVFDFSSLEIKMDMASFLNYDLIGFSVTTMQLLMLVR